MLFGKKNDGDGGRAKRVTADEILTKMGVDPLTTHMTLGACILGSLLTITMDLRMLSPAQMTFMFTIGGYLWSKKILRKRQEKAAALEKKQAESETGATEDANQTSDGTASPGEGTFLRKRHPKTHPKAADRIEKRRGARKILFHGVRPRHRRPRSELSGTPTTPPMEIFGTTDKNFQTRDCKRYVATKKILRPWPHHTPRVPKRQGTRDTNLDTAGAHGVERLKKWLARKRNRVFGNTSRQHKNESDQAAMKNTTRDDETGNWTSAIRRIRFQKTKTILARAGSERR